MNARAAIALSALVKDGPNLLLKLLVLLGAATWLALLSRIEAAARVELPRFTGQ